MERQPDRPRSTAGVRDAGDRRVATVTRWAVAAALVGAAAASSFAARGVPGRAAGPGTVRGTGSVSGSSSGSSGGLLPPAAAPGQSSGLPQVVSGGS